ncbi:MAG: TonB-dependent receptor plug domain-containing protein, partial [Reyranella sp.]|nr:TonB-dependent receptor plug domain-containing protein [Reyranella sp.]
MNTRSILYALLATTAIGYTIPAPASAQTPPPVAAPNPAASGQSPPSTAPHPVPTQLDAVTTAATRTRRPLDDVAATVSVTTTEDIDRENMQDVRDLVRNEPGVTVGNNPNRAGFQNFVIRGIGGNRVLLMVDGMRTPDFP